MTNKPFFSILIPTYNQAQYLGAALDSAIAQTHTNWEAIIINDGSTDTTAEIIEVYCNKDSRFKAIHKQNGGVASALNKGLENAQGAWICWLSSDDLFEPNKLEIHQKWINNYPDKYFFFSHFKYLNDETGEITNPELWGKIPDLQWQILEMLNSPFIHGNSICINKKVWESSGNFDESLRYGQDYDMWLRLIANNTAIYIPERTCITRFHPSQDSKKFPEAGFYDSSKAGINFLNSHQFNEIFPLVDLSNPEKALDAVDKSLRVATNLDSILYSLGSHPALIWKIMEWVWSQKNPQISIKAKQLIKTKSSQAKHKYFETPFGFMWQAIFLASYIDNPKFNYQHVSPIGVSTTNYFQNISKNKLKAESILRYLEGFENIPMDYSINTNKENREVIKEIIFVLHEGIDINSQFKYGEARAILEIAKYLQRIGIKILLMSNSTQSMGFVEDITFIGVINNSALFQSLLSLPVIDTLVLTCRADYLLKLPAIRTVIYHHSPYPIINSGDKSQKINITRTPIICVSQSSKNNQINYGVAPELINIVPNSYDHFTFYAKPHVNRLPHSLIFAGNIVSYKGIDIALKAFIKIKDQFPNAIFNVCGSNGLCNESSNHYFPKNWLDSDGYPIWQVIEQEVSGVKYLGELLPSELSYLFCQSSILVTPSRIAETFGIVSLEAQACGCISILPRKGGFSETLKEDITGYLYEDNRPDVLANLIINLWKQELPSQSQRDEAQLWVQEKFSWNTSGAKFLNILASSNSKSKNSIKIKMNYSIRRPMYFFDKIITTIKEGTFIGKLRKKFFKA